MEFNLCPSFNCKNCGNPISRNNVELLVDPMTNSRVVRCSYCKKHLAYYDATINGYELSIFSDIGLFNL